MIIFLLLLSVTAYVAVMLGMGRLGKQDLKTPIDLMYFQLLRNLGSLLLMALIARSFLASGLTIGLAAAMGGASLLSSICSMTAYKYGPVSISILIINSLSMLFASLAGPVFWAERISGLQILGIALCILSMFLLTERGLIKKASPVWVFSLLGGGIGSGIQGPIQKVLSKSPCAGENLEFVLYTFLFSTVVSLFMLLLVRRGTGGEDRVTYKLKGTVLWLFISQAALSVFLNINNLYLVAQLPTAVFFPAYSIGGLLLTTVASCLLFREKMSRRQFFGVAAGLAALFLISGILG